MRRIAILISIALFIAGLACVGQQDRARAGCIIGGGFICASAATTFQGPGDIVSGAIMWGSCARAYNAAYANGTNSLCDLVAVTGGAVVGTLRVAATGFVDLSAYFAGSVTPAAACAAASGGSCNVTKLYDQTGTGNHWTTATLSQMPPLVFSSINGLPGMSCVSANATRLATGNVTQAQPFSGSVVYERTSGTIAGGVLGGGTSATGMGGGTSANLSQIAAGTAVTQSATDNTFHALQGVFNGASSAINTDGADLASQNAGAAALAAEQVRLCRNNSGNGFDGPIMETGLWPSALGATQRGNLNTNQHGANGYNF